MARTQEPPVLEALMRVYKAIDLDPKIHAIFENLGKILPGKVNEARRHRIFWRSFFRIYFGNGDNTTVRKAYYMTGFMKEALEAALGCPVVFMIRTKQQIRVDQSAVHDLVAAAELSSESFITQKPQPSSLESTNTSTLHPADPSRRQRDSQSPSDQLIREQQTASIEQPELSDLDGTQPARAGDISTQDQIDLATGEEGSVVQAEKEPSAAGNGAQSKERKQEARTMQGRQDAPEDETSTTDEPGGVHSIDASPSGSDDEEMYDRPSKPQDVTSASSRKRKHSVSSSGTNTDEVAEEHPRKRRDTGAYDDAPPEDADFGNRESWYILRSDYAMAKPVREKRGVSLSKTLTPSEIAQLKSVYLFFLRDTFGPDGLRRCAEFVEGTKGKSRPQLEACDSGVGTPRSEMDNSSAIARSQPDSLLEACTQAYQASRSARQNSAVAGRMRLIRTVDFYRSWSKICEELKIKGGEMEQIMLDHARQQGRGLAKGKGIMTLAWDWLIDKSYRAEDIATDDAQKSARHFLRDEITVGHRLYDLQQLFGDGIFHFLPSNTPSIIRRWQYDAFKTFIDVLDRRRPSLKTCCHLMHQRLDSPSSFTRLALPAHDGGDLLPFERRIIDIVNHGMLNEMLDDPLDDEENCFPDDGTHTGAIEDAHTA